MILHQKYQTTLWTGSCLAFWVGEELLLGTKRRSDLVISEAGAENDGGVLHVQQVLKYARDLNYRRKIRLKESNAKCRYLKNS